MTTPEKGGCESCKYLRRQDYGYSNYTVTGTDVDCLQRIHPMETISDDLESEQFSKAMAFGQTCPSRVEGEVVWFDCDGTTTAEDYKDDAELYLLLTRPDSPPVP